MNEIKHEIKPVRLTEDHLIKFGFTTDDLGEDFTPEEYQYPIFRKGMVKIEYNRNGGYFKSENLVSIELIEYNFVHELQNLYYVLTGEELKFNQNDKQNF